MGAVDISCIVESSELGSARLQLAELQDHDSAMKGMDGYSGGWHLCYIGPIVKDLKLPNVDKAYELQNNIEKRSIVLVSFHSKTKADSQRWEKAEDKERQLHTKVLDAQSNAWDAFKAIKSKLVSCAGCGSRLSRKHLRQAVCPLCRDCLYSKTVINRIEKLQQKVVDCNNARIANANHGPIHWLILGCSPT